MYRDLEKKKSTKRAYYLAHREEIKKKNKTYWENHREERLIKAKEYSIAHADKIKEVAKAYRRTHKKEIKEWHREYHKEWYQKHREEKLQDAKAARLRNKRFVEEYKALNPCIICGIKNPILLVFHHRDMKEKEKGIAVMMSSSFPLHKIVKEIEKCEVLCFNCHVLVHDQIRQCEVNGTQFSLEDYIKAKKEQDIPTQSLPLVEPTEPLQVPLSG